MTTRRRNRNSHLWNYFDRNEVEKVAMCNVCTKLFSYKSTITNLKQHLRLMHNGVYQEYIARTSSTVTGNVNLNGGNGELGVRNIGGGDQQGQQSTSNPTVFSIYHVTELSSPRLSSSHVDHLDGQTQVEHIIQPQEEINESHKESHENNKTYVSFKDMKFLLEKALDKGESIREKPRPKKRIIHEKQEASVEKPNPAQTCNGLHEEINGDKYFVLSLIPTLQQMTDDQKLTAKMKILQVLQEVKKMNTNQSIVYMEDISTEDTSKVEYLDEDTSASS